MHRDGNTLRRMHRLLYYIILNSLCLSLLGQSLFEKANNIPISEGDLLMNAYAGGINSAQYSDIDLDNDGIKDLVVFDKTDNRVIPFINNGIVDEVSYTYAPEYESIFPKFRGWLLLEDFDGDGLEDIFTHNISGIKVYKSIRVGDSLTFEVVVNTCRYTSLSGNPVNIFISSVDIPAIVDVNNDGDMDILTFDQFGGTVEWYENQDIEAGGIDSLYFEKVDECWGDFYEDNDTNAVDLGVDCRAGLEAVDALEDYNEKVHAGSTLLAYDMDGDQDKELMLGDISFSNVTQLTNGGTLTDATMTAQDPLFPVYDITADIFVFPSMFRLDVDNDGIQDLLISTNDRPFAENHKNILFYKNIADDINPIYEFQSREFLTDENVDVGQAAKPSFVDVDLDGDLDMLLGNLGYFDPLSESMKSTLTLYENVGDTQNPSFSLTDRDFNNLSQYGLLGLYPSFADLDDDGDMDMVWGDEEGFIHLLENVAAPNDPMNLTMYIDSLNDEDYGKRIVPLLKDVNGDERPDLICGERGGSLVYLKNSTIAGTWEFTEVTEEWGNVNVKPLNAVAGFSSAQIVPIDTSARDVLLVSNLMGEVSVYDSMHLETFVKVDSFYLDSLDFLIHGQTVTNASRYAGFSIADLNMDSRWELMAGRERGGIALLSQTSEYALPVMNIDTTDTIDYVMLIEEALDIYPNPAKTELRFDLDFINSAQALIYNLDGKLLLRKDTENNTINVSELASGIYFLSISVNEKRYTAKFIKE